MKKYCFKNFTGLSPRYRIGLLIGAVVVGAVIAIACGAVLGRDQNSPVEPPPTPECFR